MAQKLLSLDIREDVICGVMLLPGGRAASVVNCGIASVGERPFGEAVQEVLDQVNYTNEPCRVAFGAEIFFFRNLSFPFSDRRKIEKILPIELADNVIVNMDDLVIDSLVSVEKGEDSSVVAAMIDRSLLREKLDALSEVNLDPEIVTISGTQSALQLAKMAEEKDFILVDLGCRRLTLFVMVQGKMRLVRTMVFDDGSLAGFTIDRNSQQVGPRRPEKVDDTFRSLAREIKHTLFAVEDLDLTLPVYLTGALSSVPECERRIAKHLQLVVMACDLIGDNVTVGEECGLWRGDIMTSPVALALRSGKKQLGFNFRKEEFSRKVSLDKYRTLLPKLGIPAAVCLLVVLIFFWQDLSQKKKELSKLKAQEVEIFKATLPGVRPTREIVKQLKIEIREMKKGSLGEASSGPDLKMLDIMAEMSSRIPATINVHVIRMVADRKGVLLRGFTDNFNSVDNLKKMLEKSNYFREVTINSATISKQSSGIRFELKVELNRG